MPNDDIRRSYNFAPFVRHNRGSTSDIGMFQQSVSFAVLAGMRREYEVRIQCKRAQKVALLPPWIIAVEEQTLGGSPGINRDPLPFGEIDLRQLLQGVGTGMRGIGSKRLVIGLRRELGRWTVIGSRFRALDLCVSSYSLLPQLEAQVLPIVRRELREEFGSRSNVLGGQRLKSLPVGRTQGSRQEMANLGEGRVNLRIVVGEWVIQHPHARGVSPRQTQFVYRIENAGLCVLELMKVLVHQRDLPRGTRLRVSILGFADDDDRRRSERGERRQQGFRKLSWARAGVFGQFREVFRWSGMMS